MRTCCTCRAVKPVGEFYRNYRRCGKCDRERKRKEYAGARLQRQLDSVLYTHGIAAEQYFGLHAQQHARCANMGCQINIAPAGSGVVREKVASLDHDHRTGKLRGLLCRECNIALGLLHDSPTRISGLLMYIELNGEPECIRA